MRIAYLDCASGLSGDMTLAALIDAGVPLEQVQQGIDSLGLPSCRLVVEEVKKRGFRALQLRVEHEPEDAHRHLSQIEAMIQRSRLSPRQREVALAVFRRLAQAEAKVHGTTVEKVHFHEVGAVDSIADIVARAIAWDQLGVDRIECARWLRPGEDSSRLPTGGVRFPPQPRRNCWSGFRWPIFLSRESSTTPTGGAGGDSGRSVRPSAGDDDRADRLRLGTEGVSSCEPAAVDRG